MPSARARPTWLGRMTVASRWFREVANRVSSRVFSTGIWFFWYTKQITDKGYGFFYVPQFCDHHALQQFYLFTLDKISEAAGNHRCSSSYI
jgi:hypothetical protein